MINLNFISENKDDVHVPLEKVMNVIFDEGDSNCKGKGSEENSSDVDDIEKRNKDEEITNITCITSTTRRPVRKRPKPKNEDFEYDLSNILKMEAQGYRDSLVNTNARALQSKKKISGDGQADSRQVDTVKEYVGALFLVSRKSVEKSQAHMRQINLSASPREHKIGSIFVKPSIPRISNSKTNNDKISPKKITNEEITEGNVTNEKPNINERVKIETNNSGENICKPTEVKKESTQETNNIKSEDINASSERTNADLKWCETLKTKLNIPAVVPIKFKRQSIEVIKNPIINKSISDFSKAGMKTKILVIKPFGRKDRVQSVNAPIKFQTIKLKDPSLDATSAVDEKCVKESITMVKVPKVENVTKTVNDVSVLNNKKDEGNTNTDLLNDCLVNSELKANECNDDMK